MTSLLDVLTNQLIAENEPRLWDGYFHVSQLYRCSRLIWDHANGLPEAAIEPSSLLTFRVGHSLHDMVQSLLKASGRLLEEEWELVNEQHKIKGSADALVQVLDYPEILEFKTIKQERLSELRGPLVAHVLQCMTYMWLSGHTRSGRILYLNKNAGQMKEFRVYYQAEIIDEMLEKLDYIRGSLDEEVWPREYLEASCQNGDFPKYCHHFKRCKQLYTSPAPTTLKPELKGGSRIYHLEI